MVPMQLLKKLFLVFLAALVFHGSTGFAQDDNKFASDFEKATKLVEDEKYKEAANVLAAIVKDDKDNAEAWQMLGYTLHATGDYERAIIIHKKAATYKAATATANYNLCCTYALQGDRKLALDHLEKAIDAGLVDDKLILADSDLSSLKKEPRFKELIARLQPKKTKPAASESIARDRPAKKNEEISAESAGEKKPRAENSRTEKMKPEPSDEAPEVPNGITTLSLDNFSINFIGNWNVIRMIDSGNEILREELPQISFTRNILKFTDVDGHVSAFAYKADLEREPRPAIGFRVLQGPDKGKDGAGIASGGGDLMTICYHLKNKKLPQTFQSTRENGQTLLVLERDDTKSARSEMTGKWDFVSGERAGNVVAPDRLVQGVSITRDTIILPGSHGKQLLIRFVTDSSKLPCEINMLMFDPSTGTATSKAMGIMELNKGKLSICYDPTGNSRPSKFATSEENGFTLFHLKSAAKQ